MNLLTLSIGNKGNFVKYKACIVYNLIVMERNGANLSEKAGFVVWEGFLRRLKMEVETPENFDCANEHLKKGGRVVVVHNHPGSADPAAVIRVVNQYLTEAQHVGYIASSKFFDGRMPVFKWVIDYLFSKGKLHQAFPVVQTNDTIDKNTADRLNREPLREILRFKNLPSNVICVAPEGTRSLDGAIHEASDTVEGLIRSKPSALVVPIGIMGTERIHRRKGVIVNPFASSRVVIGTPVDYEEIIRVSKLLDISVPETTMTMLSALVDPPYRGRFQENLNRAFNLTGMNDPQIALEILGKAQQAGVCYDFN